MKVKVDLSTKLPVLTGPEIQRKPGIYLAQGKRSGDIVIVQHSWNDEIFLIRGDSFSSNNGLKLGWFDPEITYLPHKKPLLVEFQPE